MRTLDDWRVRATAGAVLLLGVAGCNPMSAAMSGAQMSVKVFKGAQAKMYPLEGLSVEALRPYRSVALGQVTTDVARICTPDVVSEVRLALAQELASNELRRHFPGGDPRLVVNADVRFFKEGDLFGKEPRLDLVVTFADGATGRQVGRVYVEGLSHSPLETKAKHLAEGDAEEIGDLLKDRKSGKENRNK